MTKSTQQLADELARKCAEHCVGLNLYPDKAASLVFAKGIQRTIPLLELLEVARAAKELESPLLTCNCDEEFCRHRKSVDAITNLQKKLEL